MISRIACSAAPELVHVDERSESELVVVLSTGTQFEATVSYALLTGRHVDRPRLITEGYAEARERLLRRLGEGPGGATSDADGDARLFSVRSESGAQIGAVPFLVLESDRLFERVCAAAEDIEAQVPEVGVRLARCRANLFDFGVGTLDAVFSLTARRPLTAAELRDVSDRFRAAAEKFLYGECVALAEQFIAAINADSSQAFLPTGLSRRTKAESALASPAGAYAGKPLWIHTIYALPLPERADFELWPELASELLPSFSTRVELPAAILFPGLLVSAAAYRDGDDRGVRNAQALAHVMCQLNAWWTAIWEMDRLLFSFLNEFNTANRLVQVDGLEWQAARIAEMHEHVRLFRALLDTDQLNMAGRERGIWDAAAERWWFNTNLSAVDTKMDALRDLHSVIADEIARRRARRFDLMLAIFTMFSVIASLVSVGAFLLPAPGSVSDAVRVGIVTIVSLASTASLVLAYRVRPFRRPTMASPGATDR